MSRGLSEPFIRRPVATILVMVGIAFAGLVAYPMLPVAPLPQVDFPTIQVSASLPGASPETMATSVAQPLEAQFSQIPSISQMTSTSALGSTSITIQFDLGRDIDAAANDVQAAINAAGGQLPKTLPSPPTYRKVNPADSPIMLLTATSDTMPLTEVDDAVDTKLAQRISQMKGVSQVSIGGQQKPAVRIQIDPTRLVNKGLSLEDVRSQIAVSTVDAPKGSLDGTTRSFTIHADDQLTRVDQWNDLVVAYRNGAPIRIRDLGQAVSGPEDAKQAAWSNGKRGVTLIVFKQPGANVIDTVDGIRAALPTLTAALPSTIHVEVISDRTQTIRASVRDVQFTLILTIALVVMVIFLFLRNFWATVIPAVTVPLALLGAYAMMWMAGYSLDNLSLMALTISVGFVVDDAIVVLENIERHIEAGMEPFEAALRGAGEIGFTVVSISLSLVAVLIPLLMMGGIIGRLFREFAVSLSMTIAISAFVSLTLTPMMAARLIRREQRHGRFHRIGEAAFDAVLAAYARGLDVVLRHRFATLAVFGATLAATIGLFVAIPKGFFPQQDTGLITGITEAAQDTSFAKMLELSEALGAVVQADPAVANVAMSAGGSTGSALNTGRVYVTLKPRSERDASADQVIARLRPKLARVEGVRLFLQSAQDVRMGGRSARTQFQFTLQDADAAELGLWSSRILATLRKLPQLQDVASDQQTEGTTLSLTIDRDQAARYGITPQLIDDTLYDAFGQRQVAQFFTQISSYHVILEVRPDLQKTPETLEKLHLKSPTTGNLVPLSAFVSWTTVPVRPLTVSHQGQFPATTISFNLAQGAALGDATKAIEGAMRQSNVPPSLTGTFSGTAQAFQESLSSVPLLIAAALVVVYLILGILYESFVHPLTILSTLPSAGVGALVVLMAFGFDFSLIALIGLVLLIGIVKKNGIMLVDFAISAEREEGLSAEEAIRKAALQRFRPILMTTMAALLGAVPLMLGAGNGAELRQPLGYAMFGGLVVSQMLTLFTTPVVYLYLDRLARRRQRSPDRLASFTAGAQMRPEAS
ncbi:MAG: multidrug efflux RND transporter permease subunit [Phyllobacteriaceae bacterium]|nr:multidrug efflux RND transporter permease subunit [Phyllobacteriaceae bacterium]